MPGWALVHVIRLSFQHSPTRRSSVPKKQLSHMRRRADEQRGEEYLYMTTWPAKSGTHYVTYRGSATRRSLAYPVPYPSPQAVPNRRDTGYSLQGGAVGGGLQCLGVVLYNKLVYNIIQITTPCFHCTPLWWILRYARERRTPALRQRRDVHWVALLV